MSFRQRISARQAKLVDLEWFCPAETPNFLFLLSAGSNGTLKVWRKIGGEVSSGEALGIFV